MRQQTQLLTLFFNRGDRVRFDVSGTSLFGLVESDVHQRDGWYYVRHQSGEVHLVFWQWMEKAD